MRKLISIALVFCMIMVIIPMNTSEASAKVPKLTEKSLYKVSSYRSGDCLLCANAYMIKRMAVLMGSSSYKNISNSSLRSVATTDGVNSMDSSFTFKRGGIKYRIKSKALTGSASDKKRKIKELLKEHPEGIAVWGGYGASSVGSHAVLITGYNKKSGYFYAVDSANNYGGRNKGITSWSGTYMYSIGNCTMYYYISSVSLTDKPEAPKVTRDNNRTVLVKWSDVRGENRWKVSRSIYKDGKHTVKYVSTQNKKTTLKAEPGKVYYYRVQPYNRLIYTDWAGKKHTRYIDGVWSAPKKFTFYV